MLLDSALRFPYSLLMTRKHFEAIAARIRDLFDGNSPVSEANFIAGYARGVEDVTKELCAEFARINPNFDRARFLTACGME